MKINEEKEIQKFEIGGNAKLEVFRNNELLFEENKHNIVVNEGLLQVLGLIVNKDSIITNRYIGLFSSTHTPVPEDTASTFPSEANEFVGYGESTRQLWDLSAITTVSGPVSNILNKAIFTVTSNGTLSGIFLTTSSAKSSTTGILFSAIKFDSARSLLIGDELRITYTLNISSIA